MEPASVIVEILNEDGTMARRPDLETFAKHHNLKIGTIADLIRYRLEKERSVERIAEQSIETEFGQFRMCCFEDHVNRTVHLALIRGDLQSTAAPLVRVHLKDTLRDVVGIRDDALGWPLRSAMQRIAKEGVGVVVILRPEETPRDLMDAVAAINHPDTSGARSGGAKVLRTYGIGAQILRDLGVQRMRVLSAPKQMHGLSGFDLEVVEYVEA
jgi:3,4-dihydroxy 2-butanone 4-phosphate synthase/GTP cyclohydrolase II